jgi:hypothetical protein
MENQFQKHHSDYMGELTLTFRSHVVADGAYRRKTRLQRGREAASSAMTPSINFSVPVPWK